MRNIPQRPNPRQVHMLIKEQLRVSIDQVIAIQYDHLKGLVFVQLVTEDLQNILKRQMTPLKFTDQDGQVYDVELSGNEDLITVRIHQVPYNVPNALVASALTMFGTINGNIRNEVWGNDMPYPVFTGVRTVRMKLKKSIPFFIEIAEHKTLVT